jgi:hypothetical protein
VIAAVKAAFGVDDLPGHPGGVAINEPAEDGGAGIGRSPSTGWERGREISELVRRGSAGVDRSRVGLPHVQHLVDARGQVERADASFCSASDVFTPRAASSTAAGSGGSSARIWASTSGPVTWSFR